MSILTRRKTKRKEKGGDTFNSFFHQEGFLAESDSSIEKALFWSSNFLTVPTSGRSLINLQSSQKRHVSEKLSRMKIKLNIGGEHFVIPYKTVILYPDSLLASRDIERFYDKKSKEYFFDRDPDMFRHVFNFYKHDKIHYPMDECVQAFVDELKFFRIPVQIMKECCNAEFHDELDNSTRCSHTRREDKKKKKIQAMAEKVKHQKMDLRTRIRKTLMDPTSSNEAKILGYALLICVFLNVLGFVIETVPCSKSSHKCGDLHPLLFFTFELICVSIFTLEFSVTIVVLKKRKAFLCSAENLLFFASLVPAYITWLLTILLGFGKTPGIVDDALKAIRIFRVVKIAKSSSHLRETVASIVAATRGLSLVLVSCIIVIIVLSVLIFQLDDTFPHVPMAMWYFLVTMTSLGYGDIVPATTQGQLLGVIGVLLGVLVVCLPVPIIQNKIGASVDDVTPEPDETVLDNFYPPDYADRQRRMSRMISLEQHTMNMTRISSDDLQ